MAGGQLGSICHAAADDDLFPVVYDSGRSGLSSKDCISSGWMFPQMSCLWKTGSYHVHGAGVQCSRSDRMPDH